MGETGIQKYTPIQKYIFAQLYQITCNQAILRFSYCLNLRSYLIIHDTTLLFLVTFKEIQSILTYIIDFSHHKINSWFIYATKILIKSPWDNRYGKLKTTESSDYFRYHPMLSKQDYPIPPNNVEE